MANCHKCGKGKIRKRAGGRKKCKRCGFLGREPVNPYGSCFDAAARLILTPSFLEISMVHGIGIANKPGEEGNEIAHAWVEFTHTDNERYAIDPIWMVAQPVKIYRNNLKVNYAVEYKKIDFMQRWIKTNFPGPWDDKIFKFTIEGKQQAHQEKSI